MSGIVGQASQEVFTCFCSVVSNTNNIKNIPAPFLGLDYNLGYLPLLMKCGLVKVKRMGNGKLSYGLCNNAKRVLIYGLDHIEVTESYI